MAHIENELSSLLRLDGPIGQKPGVMRWPRKSTEAATMSNCNTSMNKSLNVSSSSPMKLFNKSSIKTPKTPKTPRGLHMSTASKTPGKAKTPGKTPKTPGGDRFIPNRSSMNFDIGHFKLHNEKESAENETSSPSKQEYRKIMSENLNGDVLSSKILSYKTKPPPAPEGFQNNLKVLYTTNKTPNSTSKTSRHIPQAPERILDAPDIIDDYYLNLLDWSCNNHLAVALSDSVYLWDATSGQIQQLVHLESPEDYISSVSWIKEGNYVAIGTSNGDVQLWDVGQCKRLRNMTGHAARVGSLSWNSFILSSGSRSGSIHHHDVRIASHHVATLAGHTQEVCGLKWSPDFRYLASGGNDNLLNVWSAEASQTNNSPVNIFTQHQAAVKAVSWCPWQTSMLASGGGTADRHIRFFNISTGACVNSVDTKSQVCGLLWSPEYKELISAHGFANNQLIIWKYPVMNKVAELLGHTSRVLHVSMSPDRSTVVSAAADETLRLWKCFEVDPKKRKEKNFKNSKTSSILSKQHIR